MKTLFVIVGVMSWMASGAWSAGIQDYDGTTQRYHNGAKLTLDPTVTVRDEDARWTLRADQLGRLAAVDGGQWWIEWQMVATITVTNAAGTTNGQTLTVNSDTRTWTTNASGATTIATNATPQGATTNLFNAVTTNGFTTLSLAYSGATAIKLTGLTNQLITASLSAGWGTVSLATNYPGLVNLVSAVTSGVSNQWRVDATNAAAWATNGLNPSAFTGLPATVAADVTNQWRVDATNAAAAAKVSATNATALSSMGFALLTDATNAAAAAKVSATNATSLSSMGFALLTDATNAATAVTNATGIIQIITNSNPLAVSITGNAATATSVSQTTFTNLAIYGDANKTNAIIVNSGGETLTNALGSVTISGGNITNTGSLTLGTNLSFLSPATTTANLVVNAGSANTLVVSNGVTTIKGILTNNTSIGTSGALYAGGDLLLGAANPSIYAGGYARWYFNSAYYGFWEFAPTGGFGWSRSSTISDAMDTLLVRSTAGNGWVTVANTNSSVTTTGPFPSFGCYDGTTATFGIRTNLNVANNGVFGGSLTATNGLIVSSNSWINCPTLTYGQNFYCSSNGVPHVIWMNGAGTLTTNRLVP